MRDGGVAFVACARLLPLLLPTVSSQSFTHLEDLPPISLSVGGDVVTDGTERAFHVQAPTLILSLEGDAFVAFGDDAASAVGAAILSSFESQQPHEPAGWSAVVTPHLVNGSLTVSRRSASQLALQLPRLPCFDLLYPEVVTVRIPGSATVSGRAVVAPPLRIRADPAVRPPRWGSVRLPPRETWRNCTHVRLRWNRPLDSGGTELAGYRLEVRALHSASYTSAVAMPDAASRPDTATEPLSLGPAIDGGWNSSSFIDHNASASAADPASAADAADLEYDASGVVGPLAPGVAYQVRVRAYARGHGCTPVPGDDGAVITLYGGWRADSLLVSAGPPGGGPIHGGTVVRLFGACMDAATACGWDEGRYDRSSISSSSDGPAGPAPATNVSHTPILSASDSELVCASAPVARAGIARVRLSLDPANGAAFRDSGLEFEFFDLRTIALQPLAGPLTGGTELRVGLAVDGTLALRRALDELGEEHARCRFFDGGDNVTVAPLHASTAEVVCPTPHAPAIGPANVSITLDGGHTYTDVLPAGRAYLYYNASLHTVDPLGGPVRGGTVATIAGGGLAGGDSRADVSGGAAWCQSRDDCAAQTRCRFGTLGGRVTPRSANDTTTICIAPPIRSTDSPRLAAAVGVLHPDRIAGRAWDDLGYVSDELTYSLNGEDYLQPRIVWTYYAPPTISSLQPADGPASGGQVVTVRGEGFTRLPTGGAQAARCRFGMQRTAVVRIINSSFLVCEAPYSQSWLDAALSHPLPSLRRDRPADGIGDDATFTLAHAGRHCCAVGRSAARVGGGSGFHGAGECEAECVLHASCRYVAYAASMQTCDLCSSCTDLIDADPTAWPSAIDAAAGSDRDGTLFDSYSRVEPPLPRLLPFSLSLNGQQFEVNDADRTAEIGYLMYAASVYNLSISGGPTAGGTLVTLSGRGFARAAARPSSVFNRFGTLWHHRNATISARCQFMPWVDDVASGDVQTTVPIELRDDQIVCPTPPGFGSETNSEVLQSVAFMLTLNAAHYNGDAPSASTGPFDVAHYEGVHATPQPFNLTLYPQIISQIVPPGGPTLGGTIVRVEGVGLQRFAPHAAACRFDRTASDADLGGAREMESAINCTAPAHDPHDAVPFAVALNYQSTPCEPVHGLVPPAFGPPSGKFHPDECVDEHRDHHGSYPAYRGSFRPHGGMPYDYYVPPVISVLFPVRGLHTGGVALTLTGSGFRTVPSVRGVNATLHTPILCGFGLSGSTPYPAPHATSAASINDAGQIVCTSPLRTRHGQIDVVSVALNGQDFEGGNVGSGIHFTYAAPLVPTTSFPLSGPVAGGSEVRVLGSGFVNATDGTLLCRFGDAKVAATHLPIVREQVEGVLVRGVYDAELAAAQHAILGCMAPSAHAAGSQMLVRRDFDGTHGAEYGRADDGEGGGDGVGSSPHGDELRGDAVVDGGSLVLAHGMRGNNASTGTIVIARQAVAPAAVVRYFEASFELQMAGRGNGDGLAFCYGPPPSGEDWSTWRRPFGENGTARGLNVHLLTQLAGTAQTEESERPVNQQLEVSYDGNLIERLYLGDALRTKSWANLTIRFDDDGLEVMHNGDRRVVNLPVYGYAPSSTWQFAIGAHAGPHGDTHRIDSLRIRSGELIHEATVPLAVSVNGQDFTDVPGGFRYFTPPVLSSASPATGPADGGTLVTLRGYGLASATQLECNFSGEVVFASRVNSTAVRCVTPEDGRLHNMSSGRERNVLIEQRLHGMAAPDYLTYERPLITIPLTLSLNGQWAPAEATAALPWQLRSPPNVSYFLPVSGPLRGGTMIRVFGHPFADGVDYFCRFGARNRTVPATYDTVHARLLCVAPEGNLTGGSTSDALEVSLNGQQFTSSGVLFTQHPSFALSSLVPRRGEALGDIFVRVNFDSFGQRVPFEDIRCRFGVATPTTPLQHTDSWALCLAPASYDARAASLQHRVPFDVPNATDGEMHLTSMGDASVSGGQLRLTDPAAGYASILSPIERVRTRAAGLGSAVLTLRRPYNALLWFDMKFELMMGSARRWSGGYGLSVCLGDLNVSQPFGEEGAGIGLRVLFKTWRTPSPPYETIEVWYNEESLLVIDVGKRLRSSSWVPVRHTSTPPLAKPLRAHPTPL